MNRANLLGAQGRLHFGTRTSACYSRLLVRGSQHEKFSRADRYFILSRGGFAATPSARLADMLMAPLQRHRPDLPTWLGQCLMNAMEKNPEKRFKDAGEFAKALENGLSQGAVRPLGGFSPRDRRIDPLQFWRGLTFLFATAFFVLLIAWLSRR